ncbi:MAG: hypothetical protein ACKVZ6_15070 [Kineosporiaceae bacterium]
MTGTATAAPAARRTSWWARTGVVLIVVLIGIVGWTQRADAGQQRVPHKPVPVNASFEGRSGIRIDRVSVVGDGGLIDVRFTVIDTQKAHRFVGDSDHTTQGRSKLAPPRMYAPGRRATVKEVASMHAHTEYRSGQTYFLIYLNPGGKIRPGDLLDLVGGAAGDAYKGLRAE